MFSFPASLFFDENLKQLEANMKLSMIQVGTQQMSTLPMN
jgi:hypothetical protein